MNNYIHVLDAEGKRITSVVDFYQQNERNDFYEIHDPL